MKYAFAIVSCIIAIHLKIRVAIVKLLHAVLVHVLLTFCKGKTHICNSLTIANRLAIVQALQSPTGLQ